MEELMMLDRCRHMMDLEVLRGRKGMLSRPEVELHSRGARDLLHCYGVVNDKDKVEDGE